MSKVAPDETLLYEKTETPSFFLGLFPAFFSGLSVPNLCRMLVNE